MGRPAPCNCFCESPSECGCFSPVVLDRWTGSKTFARDLNLSTLPGWSGSVLGRANAHSAIWGVWPLNTQTFSGTLRQNLVNMLSLTTNQPLSTPAVLSIVDGVPGFAPLVAGTLSGTHFRRSYTALMRRRIYIDSGANYAQGVGMEFPLDNQNGVPAYSMCGDVGVSTNGVMSDLEYGLVVVCQCCTGGDNWWDRDEFQQRLPFCPFLGSIANEVDEPGINWWEYPITSSSGDAIRLDAQRCDSGSLSDGTDSPCTATVVAFNGGYFPFVPPTLDCNPDQQTAPTLNIAILEGQSASITFGGDWVAHDPAFNSVDAISLDRSAITRQRTVWLGHAINPILSPAAYPGGGLLGTLDTTNLQWLRDWLDLGHRVLIIEGCAGADLLSYFGCTSTCPTHFNDSAGINWSGSTFPVSTNDCTVAAVPGHELTDGLGTLWTIGRDQTYFGGAGNPCGIMQQVAPPITLGAGAVALARVTGNVVASAIGFVPNCTGSSPIDDPVVIVEAWSGNATSKIIFSSAIGGKFQNDNGISKWTWGTGLADFCDSEFVQRLLAWAP